MIKYDQSDYRNLRKFFTSTTGVKLLDSLKDIRIEELEDAERGGDMEVAFRHASAAQGVKQVIMFIEGKVSVAARKAKEEANKNVQGVALQSSPSQHFIVPRKVRLLNKFAPRGARIANVRSAGLVGSKPTQQPLKI